VHEKRIQRLTEIHNQNIKKIEAPFDYQIRLVGEEENDILQARNNAVRDANDAYDDLIFRLDSFRIDVESALSDEIEEIRAMVTRSTFDKKHPCKVIAALRLPYLIDYINCPFTDSLNAATELTPAPETTFAEYDTLFDDFHYDIGHGKGTGTGSANLAPIQDGFGPGYGPARGRNGDFQRQQGMASHVWETPGRTGRF